MNTWKEVRFNEHYWCQNKKFTFHKKYGWEVRVAIWKADKDLKVEQVGDQDDGVAEQESQAMVETMMIDQIKSRTYLVVAGCFQHIVKTHLGQNNVWRRTGCNGGKATMAEANCESQCERYLRPTVNKYLTEKYLSPSGNKYRMPTWRGKKIEANCAKIFEASRDQIYIYETHRWQNFGNKKGKFLFNLTFDPCRWIMSNDSNIYHCNYSKKSQPELPTEN